MANNKKRRRSKAELRAIRRYYAQNSQQTKVDVKPIGRERFPKTFPFWARLKIEKHRPTLVIDEEIAVDKKTKKSEEHFVHREVTHTSKSNFDEVTPNPDTSDSDPMYLRRPTKLPVRLFDPFDKDWEIPEYLLEQYNKNNHKK